MVILSLVRLVVFGVAFVFAVIALGLAAGLTSLSEEFFDAYLNYAALTIATASLTIITLPAMIAIDFFRKGAFTSLVVVELSWLGLLWVLWLASGAAAADKNSVTFVSGCGYINDILDRACREAAGIEAFTFLNWIILMGYTIVLLVLSIIGHTRGHKIWTSTVGEAPFLAPAAGTTTAFTSEKPVSVQPTGHSVTPSLGAHYPPSAQV